MCFILPFAAGIRVLCSFQPLHRAPCGLRVHAWERLFLILLVAGCLSPVEQMGILLGGKG